MAARQVLACCRPSGALGRGCGPLVLTRGRARDERPHGLTVHEPCPVSAPPPTCCSASGLPATAPGTNIEVVPFTEIMPAVRDGKYDAGLVIHEARFVYQDYGLTSMVDLGEWWEADTGLPIPLGAIIAKRNLDAATLTRVIRSSVELRLESTRTASSADYVAEHAAEMSPDVQRRHIELYVNEFTRDLGDEGYTAIDTLLSRAHREGLIPARPILR